MHLKINDIAKLYDISAHTLRYYEEIGLVIPERSENNYRAYTHKQMEELNVIRDLRKFGIPLLQIKEYLENKTVEKTAQFIHQEKTAINKQIQQLLIHQEMLVERENLLIEAKNIVDGDITIEYFPQRRIIAENDYHVATEDVDFALKVLHKKYEESLSYLNQNLFGSLIQIRENNDLEELFYKVFYICRDTDTIQDSLVKVLPEGQYLTISYHGDYIKTEIYLNTLKNYAKENKLTIKSEFHELYLIDFNETNLPAEYVTQIQALI